MFYINESHTEPDVVSIKMDGILDGNSIQTLLEIMNRNLDADKQVILDLGGTMHVDREARETLRKYRNRISLKGLSEFLRMEIEYT
ncbi:MAG: hypothetical protein JRH15_19380 [Deltaproteobacteria bacterium]|nr:hypothetical protein [Deltaproteobacteria bacterium]